VDYPAVVPRDATGVARLLVDGLSVHRLLGIELEMGLLRQEDLLPPSYEQSGGVGDFLQRLIREQDYEPVHEGDHVIALDRADGNAITLEPGGQTEIATKPWTKLLDLDRGMREKLRPLAEAAAADGLYLIGGSLALTPQDAAPWMPKARYGLMRQHFKALGDPGRLAWVMMQRSLSTQVSLDYADDADGAELLRLGFLLAPIATAIFANSPFDGWEESGYLSYRAEVWRFTDPARSGDVEACMKAGATLTDWIDYVLDAPAMFRVLGSDYVDPGERSFREVFSGGEWPDGEPISVQDIWNQANGVFPNARAKRGMVELRSTDGQRFQDLAQIPAFCRIALRHREPGGPVGPAGRRLIRRPPGSAGRDPAQVVGGELGPTTPAGGRARGGDDREARAEPPRARRGAPARTGRAAGQRGPNSGRRAAGSLARRAGWRPPQAGRAPGLSPLKP